MAPEQLKKKYNHKVDIWACGVILYILITGQAPFDAKRINLQGASVLDYDMIKTKILKENVDFENKTFDYVDSDVVFILKQMLNKNPEKRPEANQLLTHPWFFKKTENVHRIEGKYLIARNGNDSSKFNGIQSICNFKKRNLYVFSKLFRIER